MSIAGGELSSSISPCEAEHNHWQWVNDAPRKVGLGDNDVSIEKNGNQKTPTSRPEFRQTPTREELVELGMGETDLRAAVGMAKKMGIRYWELLDAARAVAQNTIDKQAEQFPH